MTALIKHYFLYIDCSSIYINIKLLYNILPSQNRRMWPASTWIPCGWAPSHNLQYMEPQATKTRDNLYRILDSSALSTRPVTSVPGKISISTRDSYDLLSLLTKADQIKESPRDTGWILTFGRLSNSQSVSRTYFNDGY